LSKIFSVVAHLEHSEIVEMLFTRTERCEKAQRGTLKIVKRSKREETEQNFLDSKMTHSHTHTHFNTCIWVTVCVNELGTHFLGSGELLNAGITIKIKA